MYTYGIKIWTYLSSVLSQSTRLTDRQTDRQLSPDYIALHSMQRGKKDYGVYHFQTKELHNFLGMLFIPSQTLPHLIYQSSKFIGVL